MKKLIKRNAAIQHLNDKLNLSIPFENESTVNSQDPNSLLFKAEMLEKVTLIKPAPETQSLQSLSKALCELETVIKRGFAFNMQINEDDFELDVINLSNEPILTIKSQMMWDRDVVKFEVEYDYDFSEHAERELVGMIELDESLQVIEYGKSLDSLEESSIAKLLNLNEVLEELRFLQCNESHYPMDRLTSGDLRVYDLERFGAAEFNDIEELNPDALSNALKANSKSRELELAM